VSDTTVLITGTTDGLGRATALELARKGVTVLVHGRNVERCDAVMHEIREAGGAGRIYCSDFARLSDVNEMVERILTSESRLDVLVNNAGLGVEDQRRESADGHEMVFQVDYLAPFLLTRKLIPLLERSAPSRIVNVASAGQAPIDFDDIMPEPNWSGVQSYCQAKLAQISMTFEMAPGLDPKRVTINALHPASLMPTKIVVGRSKPKSSLDDGVRNLVTLAIDPDLQSTTGTYFSAGRPAKANKQAYEKDSQARLRDSSLD
jgi:NAD(P)-dependent dehydrogenase (short-subunit alcohol dehydrogenase family)